MGRALFAHAASTAAQGGADALVLDADPNADAFYLACGARQMGWIPAPMPGAPERQLPQFRLELTAAHRSK
jgi:hypothetical protein